MFKFVGILVFFLVEIDEVMSNAVLGLRIHLPRNLEGITCDVTYFDVVRDWKFLHLCNPTVLWFIPCIKNKHDSFSQRPIRYLFSLLQYNHISEQPFRKSYRWYSEATMRYNYINLNFGDGKYWKGMKVLMWINTNNM